MLIIGLIIIIIVIILSNFRNKTGGNNKKNAIACLVVIKDHYVLGACAMAYSHKKMLEMMGRRNEIDLVIMCDEYIHNKYKTTLGDFFDKVVKIDLIDIELNPSYTFSKKYSHWMSVSLNRWKIFQFTEYNKVLYTDVAVLPIKSSFYDIFDFNTPAILLSEKFIKKNMKKCKNNNEFKIKYKDKGEGLDHFLDYVAENYSTSSNIALVTPDRKIYNDYVKFVNNIYEEGIKSVYNVGPDDTSFYYFLIKYNITAYNICNEYSSVPWDVKNLEELKSIIFTTMYKPWTKYRIICYNEELMWLNILDMIFENNSMMKNLYNKNAKETYEIYLKDPKHFKKTEEKDVNKYISMENTIIDYSTLQDALNYVVE